MAMLLAVMPVYAIMIRFIFRLSLYLRRHVYFFDLCHCFIFRAFLMPLLPRYFSHHGYAGALRR